VKLDKISFVFHKETKKTHPTEPMSNQIVVIPITLNWWDNFLGN